MAGDSGGNADNAMVRSDGNDLFALAPPTWGNWLVRCAG